MDSHFGKGLTAGLNASNADSARPMANFCTNYKRSSVLGFSYRMFEKTGDRQLSAQEVGVLMHRYGLDKEMMMDFFRESQPSTTAWFFIAGYRLEV